MKTLTILLFSLCICVGCNNISETTKRLLLFQDTIVPKEDVQEEIIQPIIIEEQQSTVPENKNIKLYEDNNFVLEIQDSSLFSFKMISENADLDDLVNFIVCAYRKKVVSKFESGKQIDNNDALIVQLVLQINMYALSVFNNAITSILNVNYNIELPSIENLIKEFPEIDNSLNNIIVKCSNNTHKNNDFRNILSKWYECFNWLDPSIKEKDMINIIKQEIEHIDRIQGSAYWLIILGCPSPKAWFETNELRPYKHDWDLSPVTISKIWIEINQILTAYLQNLKNVTQLMKDYMKRSSDSKSISYLQKIQNNNFNELELIVFRTYCINYDFPFAVFCKNCYISIQGCMGSYNDDEEKMEELVYKFNNRVSGIKMLEHIVSSHTAKIYTQLLELLKAELGDKWNNVKTTCKLYDIKISTDPLNIKNDLNDN